MKKLKIIFFLLISAAFAILTIQNVHGQESEAANEQVILTYEQARQMAISDILAVQDIDKIIREMQGQRRDLAYTVRRLREAGPHQNEQLRRGAQRDLNEFDRYVMSLQLQQKQIQLLAEFALRRAVAALAEHNIQIEAWENDFVLAEDSLRRATIMHELGFASDLDLKNVQHSFDQVSKGQDELLRSKESLMKDLNTLLGLPLAQYTVIIFDMTLPEFPEYLTPHIEALVRQDILILTLQAVLDQALDERWVYTGNRNRDIFISTRDRQRAWADTTGYVGPTHEPTEEILRIRNRLSLQEAVERANLELEQAKQELEAAIRRRFNDYEGLFTRLEVLEMQRLQALVTLEVALVEYRLGLITQFEVEQTRLAASRIEQEKELLNIQKWIMSFVLGNPSLL